MQNERIVHLLCGVFQGFWVSPSCLQFGFHHTRCPRQNAIDVVGATVTSNPSLISQAELSLPTHRAQVPNCSVQQTRLGHPVQNFLNNSLQIVNVIAVLGWVLDVHRFNVQMVFNVVGDRHTTGSTLVADAGLGGNVLSSPAPLIFAGTQSGSYVFRVEMFRSAN